jgi:hypothetical protein
MLKTLPLLQSCQDYPRNTEQNRSEKIKPILYNGIIYIWYAYNKKM